MPRDRSVVEGQENKFCLDVATSLESGDMVMLNTPERPHCFEPVTAEFEFVHRVAGSLYSGA